MQHDLSYILTLSGHQSLVFIKDKTYVWSKDFENFDFQTFRNYLSKLSHEQAFQSLQSPTNESNEDLKHYCSYLFKKIDQNLKKKFKSDIMVESDVDALLRCLFGVVLMKNESSWEEGFCMNCFPSEEVFVSFATLVFSMIQNKCCLNSVQQKFRDNLTKKLLHEVKTGDILSATGLFVTKKQNGKRNFLCGLLENSDRKKMKPLIVEVSENENSILNLALLLPNYRYHEETVNFTDLEFVL